MSSPESDDEMDYLGLEAAYLPLSWISLPVPAGDRGNETNDIRACLDPVGIRLPEESDDDEFTANFSIAVEEQ